MILVAINKVMAKHELSPPHRMINLSKCPFDKNGFVYE